MNKYLFTSKSVSEGQPDNILFQMSDILLYNTQKTILTKKNKFIKHE